MNTSAIIAGAGNGAKHFVSSLHLPYLPFHITLCLDTLINKKDKHFAGQMGTLKYYLLMFAWLYILQKN